MDGWFTSKDREEEYDTYVLNNYVYVRMDQCHSHVIPWIEASIGSLSEKTVLEIGCGNGCSTVPMALRAKRVLAFDLDEQSLDIARKRCNLFNLKNVDIFCRDTTWIDQYHQDFHSICGNTEVDIIYAYALLEHLLPLERIKFLQAAWQHLSPGGHLIIFECPNRLFWYDWHSTQMPFADMLPAEIAFLHNGLMSKRSNIGPAIKASTLADVEKCSRDQLYRFGRGVSYHEFVLALGLDNISIVAGPYSKQTAIGRQGFYGDHGYKWEACLIDILESLEPPIPRDFAAPSLDLILKKEA